MLRQRLISTVFESRRFARCNRCYHELSFAEFGNDPASVLKYVVEEDASDEEPPSYLEDAVRVEMWHAPLNPADINTVQGRYPLQDSPTRSSRFAHGMTVAGSEGWGRVTDVVGHSDDVQVGDVVVVGYAGLGTWRSSLWTPATTMLPLKQGHELNEVFGAQFAPIPQLGGTALRMLRDFVQLQPGDVVVQNAGNSGVGFMASQLGRTLLDVSVVSLARRGSRSDSEWEELVRHLTTDGKCVKVVAEEELMSSREALKEFQSELQSLSGSGQLPLLALNAVGGDSASILTKCLEKGGTMVTFGGMSMQPVTIPTPHLIFRDLRMRGYWHSRWMMENSLSSRKQLLDELAEAVLTRKVVGPPVKEFALSQFSEALSYNRSDSAIRRKVVFRCQE